MAFEREYRFCWNMESQVTECTLTGRTGWKFVIAPSTFDEEGYGTTYVSIQKEDGELVSTCLGLEAQDQLIAELQRARAGCFIGEWPRPAVTVYDQDDDDCLDDDDAWSPYDDVAALAGAKPDPTTVRELIAYLLEHDLDEPVGVRFGV